MSTGGASGSGARPSMAASVTESGTLARPSEMQTTSTSPTSPVFDAYPADFELDQNGKRAEWEAIALLPFIDETRLLAAVDAIAADGGLTEYEQKRNVLGGDLYYRHGQEAPASE